MMATFYKYFIPHSANNYHPHILHTKRAIFYSAVFLTTKVLMILFVILLPVEVFGLPDILAEEQRQIIALTNQVRNAHQRITLAVSGKLDSSAQYKSDDMASKEYFAHTYDNKSVSDWLNKAGYNYEVAGENLAVGYATAEEVVSAWVKSPAHYANLVDTDYKDFGVGLTSGYYEGQPTVFVAQHFGSPAIQEQPAVAVIKKTAAVKVVKVLAPPSVINSVTPTPAVEVTLPAASSIPNHITSSTNFDLAGEESTSSVLSEKEQAASSTPSATSIDTTTSVAAIVETNVSTTPLLVNNHVESVTAKYIQAKNTLTPITNIFNIARWIYMVAMVFFIWALALKIFIEFKKQHPHVIMQTSALIALLFILWKF